MRRPHPAPRTCALAGLLAFLGGVGSAAAASPKLIVLPVGLDQLAQNELGNLMYAADLAAQKSQRFQVLALHDELDPEGKRRRSDALAQADQELSAGQANYDQLEAQGALTHFERALKLYAETDLSRSFNRLTQAWVMKVASLIANGDAKLADVELKRLLAVNPDAELSPSYFPPDKLSLAKKYREAVRVGGITRLEIRTVQQEGQRAVNGQVYVDGVYRGVAPREVQGLAAAEHYVTVIAPGDELGQRRAESGAVEFLLRRAPDQGRYRDAVDKISGDPVGSVRDQAARVFGSALGADQVLLVLAAKSVTGSRLEVTAIRLDARDGHNLGYRTGLLELGGLASGAESLFASVVAKDAPRSLGPVSHFAQAPASPQNKTLAYLVLGTGAALVATGIGFGVNAALLNRQFQQTPTDPLRSRGRTSALAADALVLGGLAAGIPGAYFVWGVPGVGEKPRSPVPAAERAPVPEKPPAADAEPAPAAKRRKIDLRDD